MLLLLQRLREMLRGRPRRGTCEAWIPRRLEDVLGKQQRHHIGTQCDALRQHRQLPRRSLRRSKYPARKTVTPEREESSLGLLQEIDPCATACGLKYQESGHYLSEVSHRHRGCVVIVSLMSSMTLCTDPSQWCDATNAAWVPVSELRPVRAARMPLRSRGSSDSGTQCLAAQVAIRVSSGLIHFINKLPSIPKP